MSWQSDKTGRPKEEGGHQRLNISVDVYTRQVLDNVPNNSVFFEQTVCDYTRLKVKQFNQCQEVSNTTRQFKNSVSFTYEPTFNNCEIKQVNLVITYNSSDGNAEFRLVINNQKCPVLVQKNLPGQYTFFHSYDKGEMGFKPFESVLRGKDMFIFKIQFRPLTVYSSVIVSQVKMFLEIVDAPLIESMPLDKSVKSEENSP